MEMCKCVAVVDPDSCKAFGWADPPSTEVFSLTGYDVANLYAIVRRDQVLYRVIVTAKYC
jgi:hypothetical protein